MVRTYTGGESAESVLEPSFFDVAIALSEESLPNQVPAVVALEMSQMEGGWRGVANGSIVFIDEGRTWEVSMTNIRPMHLPYSWAMLHARELMADAGVARDSCYRYPERAVHVAEGRGALGDAVARFEIADAFKTRSIRIKLPIVKQGAQIKVVCDPLHAAQLAGFGGSLETLYAVLYMFKDNTRGKTIIEQRFYAALQATLLQIMVGPSALQLEGSQPYNLAYFIAPDRPGMVRAIYGALLQGGQEVLGIAPAEDDVAADLLERGRSLTCFALPEGRVNLPEEALRALCAGLPAIPEGYLTRRHRLSVRVNRPYREVLPLVFGVFSDEGVNLGNLQVPVRPEGEDAAVGTQLLFEVEIPQRGGGTLRRVLQNLNSRAMRGRGITGGKEMVKGKDRLWEDLDTRSVMTMFPSK
jgi:hypothetical protein